jgi:hypothetical protein
MIMGRIVTPKYRVEDRTNGMGIMPFAWNGKPTKERLEAWRVEMNKSFQPGGNNGHVSTNTIPHITHAKIVNQKTGAVVAETAMPMFEVV